MKMFTKKVKYCKSPFLGGELGGLVGVRRERRKQELKMLGITKGSILM